MDITEAKYLISNPLAKDCPKPDRHEFAFIGRSNVGKSSLINMITGRQHLAKTSGTPGKTQLINHFEITSRSSATHRDFTNWYLVDLPGYGYAKQSHKTRKSFGKMIEEYLKDRTNLSNIFILIDSRHEPQKIDLEFINQLGEWQLPFSIVFTKADKVKPGALDRNTALFLDTLKQEWEELPPHFISSVISNTGKTEILAAIDEVLKMKLVLPDATTN